MSPGPAKQFDRDEVLERAMQLFWAEGYEATGMTRILEHVGIGRQSLYDTFGDKRGLFLETLAHYFRTRVGPVMAQLREPGSPVGNIRKVVAMLENEAKQGRFHGCLVGNTAAEIASNDPEIAEKLGAYFRALEDAFHDTFVRAQEAGEVAAELDPRDLARVFLHTLQGVAVVSKAIRDPEMASSVIRSSLSLLTAS